MNLVLVQNFEISKNNSKIFKSSIVCDSEESGWIEDCTHKTVMVSRTSKMKFFDR